MSAVLARSLVKEIVLSVGLPGTIKKNKTIIICLLTPGPLSLQKHC